MTIRRQLVLTAIVLIVGTLVASATVILWNGARQQTEDQAVLIAASAARVRDPNSVQQLVDTMAGGTVQAVRVLDDGLSTVAATGTAEKALGEIDRAHIEHALRGRHSELFQDAEGVKVAVPTIDGSGQIVGAVLVGFAP